MGRFVFIYILEVTNTQAGFILTQEVCYQYWPCANVTKFGEFTIKILNSTRCDGYTERILSVTGKVIKVGINHLMY